jgi:hypothetical protein
VQAESSTRRISFEEDAFMGIPPINFKLLAKRMLQVLDQFRDFFQLDRNNSSSLVPRCAPWPSRSTRHSIPHRPAARSSAPSTTQRQPIFVPDSQKANEARSEVRVAKDALLSSREAAT